MTDTQADQNETPLWKMKIPIKEYSEIAEAIGQIALTWNSIHDGLSQIFARVTELEHDIAYAIWNAVKSDRTQRSVLRAAVRAANTENKNCNEMEKISSLLQDLDKFSVERNSAVHCPFTVVIDLESEISRIKVIPNDFSNNELAKKFKNTDILSELQERDSKLATLKERTQEILWRL